MFGFGWATAIWAGLKGLGSISGLITMKKNQDLIKAGEAKEREKAKDEAIESAMDAERSRRTITDSVRKFDRNPNSK